MSFATTFHKLISTKGQNKQFFSSILKKDVSLFFEQTCQSRGLKLNFIKVPHFEVTMYLRDLL